MSARDGWECGEYTRKHIEYLQKTIEELEVQVKERQSLLDALKARQCERSEAVRVGTMEEHHQKMIDNMAHHLSKMTEKSRMEVIGKAQSWANHHAYAATDDGPRLLAVEVSRLNGYALGTFMQHLMKIGDSNQ